MNKFEMLLDFLVNFKVNKSGIDKITNEVKNIIAKIDPSVDLNNDANIASMKELVKILYQAEDAGEDLQTALKGLEIDIDDEEIRKSLDEIEKQFESIGSIAGDAISTDFTRTIEEIDDSLSNLSDADIKKISQQFLAAQQEAEELLTTQKTALQALKVGGKEGSDAYNQLEKDIAETENKLKSFGNIAKDEMGIIPESAGKAGKSLMEKMAVVGLAMSAIDNVSQAVNSISAPYVELDKATQSMKTLGDEAAEMAPRLRDSAVAMSKELPFGAADLQAAMTDALASGVQGGEEGLKKFAETSAKLAVGGGAQIGAVVQGLGATLNAFGETSEATGKYADTMFNIVNAGVTSIDELNQYLSGVTPNASAMGLAFDKVGGSLALMTQKGVPTSQAVTKLNALLVEMAKPSAGVSSALDGAGISLEEFHKMIADDNWVGALSALQEGFDKTGKTATQAFSSTEASSAFNVLMGDVNMLQESLDFVSNTTGSTEFAYEQMSESIEVRTQKMKAQFDAFMISVADSTGIFGELAIVGGQTFTSLAPTITALVGLGGMIPQSAIDKVDDFSKTLLKKLVPATATAEAGQKRFNLEILKNPYVIAAAAIAGLVVGLHYLSDALHDTAKEKKEDMQSQKDLLNTQIETVNKQKDLANSNLSLAESFKAQGEEAMNNQKLMLNLSRAYPGVIDKSKSYADNLKALENATSKTNDKLNKFNDQLFDLQSKQLNLDLKITNIEVDVAKEGIEDKLTDAFSEFSWDKVMKGAGVGTAIAGPFGTAMGAAIGAVGDQVSEFAFGTSSARKISENLIKSYTKGIYEAKNSDELAEASLDFQMAMFNDEAFAGLDEKQKQEIIKQIQAMAEAKQKAIEAGNRNLEEDLKKMIKFNKSDTEIVEYLSKQYGLTKDQIKDMIAEQKKSKDTTKDQTNAVTSLAEAWDKARQDASKAMNEQLSTANELAKQLQGKGLSPKQRKELQAQYDESMRQLRAQVKEKKNSDKIDEINQIRAGLIEKSGKSAYEIAKESFDLKSKDLDLEMKRHEFSVMGNVLSEKRQKDAYDELLINRKQLDILKEQRREYIEAMEKAKMFSLDSEGNIEFKANIKPAEKQEIQSALQDMDVKIQSQAGNIQGIELQINVDEKELNQQLTDLDIRKFQWEVEMIFGEDVALEMYGRELEAKSKNIQSEIEENNLAIKKINEDFEAEMKKLGINATQEEKDAAISRHQSLLRLAEKKNITLLENQQDNNEAIYNNDRQLFDLRLNAFRENQDRMIAKADERYNKEIARIQELNDTFNNSLSARVDSQKDKSLSKIDNIKSAELKKIEDWEKLEAISKEEAEKRKADIEEKYRKEREKKEEEFEAKRRTALTMSQAYEKAAQYAQQVEIANIQKDGLSKQISTYEEMRALGPLTPADTKALEELNEQFQEAEKIIQEKGNLAYVAASELGDSLSVALTEMFAGDSDAAAQSLKDYFITMSGIMIKGLTNDISKVVLKKVLEIIGASGDGWVSVFAAPIIYATVSGAVNAIAQPLLQPLSFATGGRIDQPTLAVVGDASKLGSQNREWIFSDPQLIATIQMASAGANAILLERLSNIEKLLSSQQLTTKLKGQDIYVSLQRTTSDINRRSI